MYSRLKIAQSGYFRWVRPSVHSLSDDRECRYELFSAAIPISDGLFCVIDCQNCFTCEAAVVCLCFYAFISFKTLTNMVTDNKIRCMIWDVDDTLYDVSTGFTSYRNGPVVWQFMVDHLAFPSLEAAQQVRDTYFEIYHSTAKALTVAQQEGKFPPNAPVFQTADLSQYWADHLNFTLLTPKTPQFLQEMQSLPVLHIAFSNGPRIYVQRVLQQLGLWDTVFREETLFAVDDVLPFCKPEKEAFDTIFQRIHMIPEECIMVEDSMKNIRRAKELGMKTIFIAGQGNLGDDHASRVSSEIDPAVDVAIETVEQLQTQLPALWSDNPSSAFPKL